MSALAVLALHAGMAVLLLRTVPPFALPRAPPEAVLLELPPEPEATEPHQAVPPEAAPPPLPAAPMVDAATIPVPPLQTEEPPQRERAIEPDPPASALLAVPHAEVVLPAAPPLVVPTSPPPRAPATRPARRPHLGPPRPPAPAPVQSARPNPAEADPAPAATPAPPAPSSNAVPTWRSELIARLQRSKRYPDAARSRGDQGVAVVTFTMDRSGRVLTAVLARSSGIAALDDEAIAMLHRAEPLPAMPAEMPSLSVTLTMPVSFALR